MWLLSLVYFLLGQKIEFTFSHVHFIAEYVVGYTDVSLDEKKDYSLYPYCPHRRCAQKMREREIMKKLPKRPQ